MVINTAQNRSILAEIRLCERAMQTCEKLRLLDTKAAWANKRAKLWAQLREANDHARACI